MDQRGWIACDHQVTSHLFSSPLNDEWRWTALQRLFILCGLKRILTSLNFLRAHLLAPNEIRRSRRTTRTGKLVARHGVIILELIPFFDDLGKFHARCEPLQTLESGATLIQTQRRITFIRPEISVNIGQRHGAAHDGDRCRARLFTLRRHGVHRRGQNDCVACDSWRESHLRRQAGPRAETVSHVFHLFLFARAETLR